MADLRDSEQHFQALVVEVERQRCIQSRFKTNGFPISVSKFLTLVVEHDDQAVVYHRTAILGPNPTPEAVAALDEKVTNIVRPVLPIPTRKTNSA